LSATRTDIHVTIFTYRKVVPVKASSLPATHKALDHLEQIQFYNLTYIYCEW